MRGRPTETFRFQDNDSIVTLTILRTARPRSEIGHRPDRATPLSDRLSSVVRDFVIGTQAQARYRLPTIELPPIEDNRDVA